MKRQLSLSDIFLGTIRPVVDGVEFEVTYQPLGSDAETQRVIGRFPDGRRLGYTSTVPVFQKVIYVRTGLFSKEPVLVPDLELLAEERRRHFDVAAHSILRSGQGPSR